MWPFSLIKKQKLKIRELENIVSRMDAPISFDCEIMYRGWEGLSKDEQMYKLRTLDMILTLKKSGRWDYKENCAKELL